MAIDKNDKKRKAFNIDFGVTPAAPAASENADHSRKKSETAPGMMVDFVLLRDATMIENDELKAKVAEFDGASATKLLDPKSIQPSKWANRQPQSFESAAFQQLKDEIESAGGNRQPIKVRPLPGSDPQTYEIVFGHRRHRACLELGIDVLAMIEEVDDQTLFADMDRENRQREDLRPYEQGVMYAKALDDGLFPSGRKLSESVGIDLTGLGKLLKLARLPKVVLDAFENPLDLKYDWGPLLSSALEKNPDLVFAKAAEIAQMSPRLKANEVFSLLTSVGVESLYPPPSKPVLFTGKGGTKAKLSFDPAKKRVALSIDGLPATRLNDLQQLVEKFLGK